MTEQEIIQIICENSLELSNGAIVVINGIEIKELG